MVIEQLTYRQPVYKLTRSYMSLTENIIWFGLLLSHPFHESLIILQMFTKLHDIDYIGIESKELTDKQNNLSKNNLYFVSGEWSQEENKQYFLWINEDKYFFLNACFTPVERAIFLDSSFAHLGIIDTEKSIFLAAVS